MSKCGLFWMDGGGWVCMGHYSKWVGGGELFDNAHLILGHEIKNQPQILVHLISCYLAIYFTLSHEMRKY